jgi:hypothetical protein
MAKKNINYEDVAVEVTAMSSKDAIILSGNDKSTPATLYDTVRAMAALDNTISNCSKAKDLLQETLNSYSESDIKALFPQGYASINGKIYQIRHKIESKMDYNVDTLASMPEAKPYLSVVPAYNKLDKAAYNKDLLAGSVDAKVSAAISITTHESNELKEVK